MKCVFLPEAVEDIDRLYDFLLQKDVSAAQKAMSAIDKGMELLRDNPKIGVPMEGRPERQLFIPFGNSAYVLRYRMTDDQSILAVVRVWHGREARQ